MLENSSTLEKKCGTRLSLIAETIKKSIESEDLSGLNSSQIVYYLAAKFYKNIQDPQAKMYAVFFKIIAEVSLFNNNFDDLFFIEIIIILFFIFKQLVYIVKGFSRANYYYYKLYLFQANLAIFKNLFDFF